MSNQTTMASLGQFSREELRNMHETQNVQVFQFPEVGVTVAIRDAGNNFADIAVSYQADDETKFRKNVGEYLARGRLEYGPNIRVKLGIGNYEYFAGIVSNMAYFADC